MTQSPDEIRRAVASGEFAKAGKLWDVYAERLRAAILDRTATAANLEEAGQVVWWARTLVKCFRARANARIAQAKGRAAYVGAFKPEPRVRATL